MSNKYISLEHVIRLVSSKSPGVNFNESVGISGSSQPVGVAQPFLRPITKERRFGLDTARTAANQRTAAPQATFEGGKPARPTFTPTESDTPSVADLSARGASEGGKKIFGKKLREQKEDKDENTNLDLIKRKSVDGTQPEPVRFKSSLEQEMEKAGMPKPSLSFQPPPPTPEQMGSPPPQPGQPPVEQGASPHYGSMERYTNPASEVVPPADIQAIEQGKSPVSAPASVPQSIPPKEQSIGDTIRQTLQNPGAGLPTVAGLAGAAGLGGDVGAGAAALAPAEVGGAAALAPILPWLAAGAGTAAGIKGIHDIIQRNFPANDFSQFQQAAPAQSATQAAGVPKERAAPPPTTQQWLDVKPHLDSQRTMGRGVTTPTQRVGDTPVFDPSLAHQSNFTSPATPSAVGVAPNLSSARALPSSKTQDQFTSAAPAAAQPYKMDSAQQQPFTSAAPAQAASIIDQQARALPRQQTGMSSGSAIPAGAAAVGIPPKENIAQGRFTSAAPASIPMPGIENQKRAPVQANFTSTADPTSAAGIAPNITSTRALPSSKVQDQFTSAAPAAAQPYKMDSAQQQPFTSAAGAAAIPRPGIENQKRAGVQSNFTSAADPAGAAPVGIAPNITSPHALPTSKRDQVASAITPPGAQAVSVPPSLISPRDPAAKRQQDAFVSGIPNAAIQPAIETQRRAISPTDPSVSAAAMQKPAIDNSIAAPAKFAVTPPITSPAVQSTSSMIDQQARAVPKTHAPETMNADNPTAAGIAPNITSTRALPSSKTQDKFTSSPDMGAIAPSVAATLPAIEKQARSVLPTDPEAMAGIAAHQKPVIDQSVRGATGKETSTIPPYSINPMATTGQVPVQSTAPVQASTAALPKAGTKADEVAPPIAGAQTQAPADAATQAATKEAPKDEKGEEKGGGMVPWLMGAFGLTAAAAAALASKLGLNMGPKTSSTATPSKFQYANQGQETGYRGFDPIMKKLLKSQRGGTPEMAAATTQEAESGMPEDHIHLEPHEKEHIKRKMFEEVSKGTRERRKLEIIARDMMTNRKKNKLQARQDAYKKQIIDEEDRVDIMRQAITDAQEKRGVPSSKKKVNNTNGKTPVDTHPKLKPEPQGSDVMRS